MSRCGRELDRGSAFAELALVLPLILALLLVVFDVGQGFLAYISISNGARDGARAAMLDGIECSDAGVSPVVLNGAAPYRVSVSVAESSGRCHVTVTYSYTPIVPFVTAAFELPFVGTVGPLWDGTMSQTAVSE